MIGETISHYQIVAEIGAGGMGVVYKALDLRLDRYVAIKFLPSQLNSHLEAKTRFIQEAKAASALQHANVVVIHEIDETPDGHMFIVMGYCDGETLQERLARGRLSVAEAVEIVSQIAAGLTKAHEKKILHRDVKPSNILLTHDGEAKLADFGLAKLADRTRLTKPGVKLGTVAYMSPERLDGAEIDHRSDIFSLGVVLYELLTGDVPFKGADEVAVMFNIIHRDPDLIREHRDDVPEELERIIRTALQKDVDGRYQSAADMLADLATLRRRL